MQYYDNEYMQQTIVGPAGEYVLIGAKDSSKKSRSWYVWYEKSALTKSDCEIPVGTPIAGRHTDTVVLQNGDIIFQV